MEWWSYVLLGLAPGVFWLWFLRHKDDFEPEPRLAVLFVFALGGASGWLILAVRPLLDSYLFEVPRELARVTLDAFVVTAPAEECAKALAFLLGASWRRHLDEPLDGIVYGTAAGLGFASFENIHYLLWTHDASLIVLRAFTSTLLHVGASGMLGFFFGLCRFRPWSMMPLLAAVGLATSIGVHGLYNYFLMRGQSWGYIALVIVLPLTVVALGLKIHWARVRSPDFHTRHRGRGPSPKTIAKARMPRRPKSGKLRLRLKV